MASLTTPRARSYLPGVEAARGVAAFLVLLYHASQRLLDTTYFTLGHPRFIDVFFFGARGVDLFFVLSGFVITYAHRMDISRPERLPVYAVRRLMRIYPVYWAVLAIVVFGLVHPSGAPFEHSFAEIVTSVLLLPTPDYPMVDAAWTLRHEMLFYILFAVAIFNRRWGIGVFAAWLAGILLVPLLTSGFPQSFFFSSYNAEFFAGIAVALITSRYTIPRPKLIAASGAALFLITGLLYNYTDWLSEWGWVGLFSSGSALVLAGLSQLHADVKIPRFALFGGRISYPLYIVQPIAMPVICQLLATLGLNDDLPPATIMLVIMAGSIGGAILLHHAIERPFQKLSGRTVSRIRQLAANQIS